MRHFQALILAVFALLVVVVLSGGKPNIADDTFITFQYARNLADQGMLTWNQELPIVDGFTSLGHVLLLALGRLLGFDMVFWNSVLMFSSFSLIVGLYLILTKELPFYAVMVGLVVMVLNADFLFWISRGLDAVLYAAAFFLAYATFESANASGRLGLKVGASLLALAIMRPEGIYISSALVAYFWLSRSGKSLISAKVSAFVSSLVVAGVVSLVFWRLLVYGHPLPNAYYAKTSASLWLEAKVGIEYLFDWVTQSSGSLVLISVLAVVLGSKSRVRFLFVVGQIAIVVLEGGDPHPGFRFFLPIVPLIAVDSAWVISRLEKRAVRVAVILVSIVIPQWVLNPSMQTPLRGAVMGASRILDRSWPFRSVQDDQWSRMKAAASREFGNLLAENTPVAANDVGALAYYSGRPILDTHGLNHPVISRLPKPEGVPNKWGIARLDYLIEKAVPVIYLWFPRFDNWTFDRVSSGSTQCGPQAKRVAQLVGYDLPGIQNEYLCVSVASTQRAGRWHNFFVRRGNLQDVLVEPDAATVSQCTANFRAACGFRAAPTEF